MHDETILNLSDNLCACELALREAQYIADTVYRTFCPVWSEANDPRKGAEFVRETSIAMGMVCGRIADAVQHISSALQEANL